MLTEDIPGHSVAEVLSGPEVVHVIGSVEPVEPVEEVGDPADAALGQCEADVGEPLEHSRPQQVGAAGQMLIGCMVIITSPCLGSGV